MCEAHDLPRNDIGKGLAGHAWSRLYRGRRREEGSHARCLVAQTATVEGAASSPGGCLLSSSLSEGSRRAEDKAAPEGE